MAVIDSVLVLVVSLVIGSIGIYLGGMFVTGEGSFRRAIGTAIIGAIVWALLAWIPVIGTLLALLSWIMVINMRYSGGWINAILIGLASWLAALGVLYLLAELGIGNIGAMGIPRA